MTGATSGAETAYPPRALEFAPGFSGVRVTLSLVLYVPGLVHVITNVEMLS
jgi:hypothetical protein